MQSILPLAYLPPIDYMVYLTMNNSIQIELHETYPKQTYRNRCYIYGPNGKQILTIPVIKPQGNHTKTKDIIIDYKTNWQIQHWRSIQTAYHNTPFFLYYGDQFAEFYEHRILLLKDFNLSLLKLLCTQIGIQTVIHESKDFTPLSNERNIISKIHPKEKSDIQQPPYFQSFSNKYGFIKNLSIIDLLFNLGPETKYYLTQITKTS